MAQSNKPTIADVFTSMQALRTLLDGLTADNAAQVKQTALMQLDQTAALVKAALPEPGTYVTAGAAGAMAAVSLFSGVAGGIFIGRKFFPTKPEVKAAEPAAGELPAAAGEANGNETPPRRRRRVAAQETPR